MLLALFPLTFGTSTLRPADTLPGWLQTFTKVNPITHLVGALRGLMLGGPVADRPAVDARLDGRAAGGVRPARATGLPAPRLGAGRRPPRCRAPAASVGGVERAVAQLGAQRLDEPPDLGVGEVLGTAQHRGTRRAARRRPAGRPARAAAAAATSPTHRDDRHVGRRHGARERRRQARLRRRLVVVLQRDDGRQRLDERVGVTLLGTLRRRSARAGRRRPPPAGAARRGPRPATPCVRATRARTGSRRAGGRRRSTARSASSRAPARSPRRSRTSASRICSSAAPVDPLSSRSSSIASSSTVSAPSRSSISISAPDCRGERHREAPGVADGAEAGGRALEVARACAPGRRCSPPRGRGSPARPPAPTGPGARASRPAGAARARRRRRTAPAPAGRRPAADGAVVVALDAGRKAARRSSPPAARLDRPAGFPRRSTGRRDRPRRARRPRSRSTREPPRRLPDSIQNHSSATARRSAARASPASPNQRSAAITLSCSACRRVNHSRWPCPRSSGSARSARSAN